MLDAMPAAFGPPSSADNPTVILWAVGILMGALSIVVVLLWRKMIQNETECREQNRLARDEAASARKDAARLYEEAIKATASRESKLVEVVERNTAAFNALKDTVGSGYHRALERRGDGT